MSQHKRLFDYYSEYMPSSREVVKEGISRVLKKHRDDIEYIKKNFSRLVRESESEAYSYYLECEKESWIKGLNAYLHPRLDQSRKEQLEDFLYQDFEELTSFFTSLANSRRARAGGAFQYIIKDLLSSLDYPFVENPRINGIPDFLFPSTEHYIENPVDCIILTVKRKIRERWRQIVTEGSLGLGFFLATIDEDVSENTLIEMTKNHIFLVVPISVKHISTIYSETSNVVSFETFFEDYLDPAMNRWKKAGISIN